MSSVSPPPLTDLLGGNAGTSTETTPSEYIPPIPHHTASSSSSSFGNLSPSILIIILILTVTLVASVSLCFLLRHLNRRCLRHLSAAPAASSASSASSSAAALSSRRVSPETPADSLLESLPLFAFSSITRPRSDAAADCAVCLSKFEPDDQLRLLPLCCHAFHALCVDTWLRSNQTCPLCRSPIVASEAEILKTLGRGGDSFRIEIGNVSRRETAPFGGAGGESRRSYSIGSFDYLVEDDSEVVVFRTASSELKDFENVRREIFPPATATATEASLAADVASSGRSWLKDYVDRLSTSLSSRAASFRSSGRFFSGSSRRSDVVLGVGEWDLEASRVGEEISELFRWVSGV